MFFFLKKTECKNAHIQLIIIHVQLSPSGPLISDTFSCLYRGKPFSVLKITFTVYYSLEFEENFHRL